MPQAPELVFHIGAEGGSARVWRLGHGSSARYRVERHQCLLDDLPSVHRGAPSNTFAEALVAIGAGWERLYPIFVHADVAGEILAAVERSLASSSSQRAHEREWFAACTQSLV